MLLPHTDEVFTRRLTKAGSTLVIRLPFFGYLLFGSGVRVIANDIKTMATDGVNVYVGMKFVLAEDIDIVMFGLLHELIHIYFSHVSRCGAREMRRWNVAIDIFTNMLCAELLGSEVNGRLIPWVVPKRFIQPQSWAIGKTVEVIYDLIKQFEQQDPDFMKSLLPSMNGDGDGEISDGTDIIEPPVDAPDPQDNKEWQSTFRNDVAHAKALSEKTANQHPMSKAVRSRMDKIMRATLPWGSLLRGTLDNDLGWEEASYCPPKIKYYPLGIILPTTKDTKERILVLLVDVSTSVTQELIRIFITNVQAAAMRATEVVIITFDEVVREHYRTKLPRQIFSKVKFLSGAHSMTSAIVAFELAVQAKPSAICCLTDGYIDLPETPVKNTTFVIPEGGKKQPWGKHYIMEHPWR